jgi:NADH-quinone oxidoreductase subunit C
MEETNDTTAVKVINTEFEDNVKSKLAAAIVDCIMLDMLTITVKKDSVFEVLKTLKEEKELGFAYLTTMCGTHFPNADNEVMGMTYMLHNLEKNWRIRIKTYFKMNDAEVQSVTPIFDSANWMEREAWDFYGIKFKGHPNLIRILNMEDINFFPMRKDFPLEDPNRGDKDDSQFGR